MDRYVMHQVVRVHTNAIIKAPGLEPGPGAAHLPELGNVGPASMPMTLAQQSDQLRDGDRVLCMGVGSGLNTAMTRDRLVTPASTTRARHGPAAGAARSRPAWSRLVVAVDADGVARWHVLDNGADSDRPSRSAPCSACTATRPGRTCGATWSPGRPRARPAVAA